MNKIYPYAGFWRRALAFMIDGLILAIPYTLISCLLLAPRIVELTRLVSTNGEPTLNMMLGWMASMIILWIVNLLLLWLYFACMESSKHQATLGKMALGIKVVGAHGERISFARATGRSFAKFISHMLLYFGDYMAGFTEKRQALHDIIATTYVVDKTYQQEQMPTLPFSKGGCTASIIVTVSPFVMYMGLIILMFALGISSSLQEEQANTDIHQPTAITQQARP